MIFAIVGLFVVLLMAGVPIAYCIVIAGIASLKFIAGMPLILAASDMYHTVDSFILIAIPMFFLTGNLMASGDLSRRLVDFASVLTEFVSGGLGVAVVLACGLFAAITGSSTTGLIAIGAIMFGSMVERGYDKKFSAGLLMTAGSLGILIPPSIPLIVYSHIANISVSKAFLGGVVPGILVIIVLAVYSIIANRKMHRERKTLSVRRVLKAAYHGAAALLLPVVVLGGIYGGWFTVTEAAAVSVAYALLVEGLIYRTLTWKRLVKCMDEAALFSAAILIIIAMASFLGKVFTLEQVPQHIAELVTSSITNKFVLLAAINVLLLFVGTFMDVVSAMLILVPILLSVTGKFGIDPIHLAIIFVINMEIGFMTPPVGLNLFAAQGITKLPFLTIVRSALPTIGLLFIVLLLVTYIPALSLWLPGLH